MDSYNEVVSFKHLQKFSEVIGRETVCVPMI